VEYEYIIYVKEELSMRGHVRSFGGKKTDEK
jgi:hypothetical protein